MLLVHYNDLKADCRREIGRIADFLGIAITEHELSDFVAAADFDVMKAQGDKLLPNARNGWDEGASRFFHRGTNGRWQSVFSSENLANYDAQVKRKFTPSLAAWVERGASATGDPHVILD
jgi:hypothetical protein